MSSLRSSSLAASLLLVCVSLLLAAQLTGAALTLDWSAPNSEAGLTYPPESAPSVVAFNDRVYLAWSNGQPSQAGYVYIQTSLAHDGANFNLSLQAKSNWRTKWDPELVTVYDAGTGQTSLVLLYADNYSQLQYAVYNAADGTWPSRASPVAGISNVGADLDALAIPTANSGGHPSLLCFVYAVNGSSGPSAGWEGCGQLKNGVLTATAGPIAPAVSWTATSRAAVFFLPPYGLGVMLRSARDGRIFTTQTPTLSTSFNVSKLQYPSIASNATRSGFAAAQFSVGACSNVVSALFTNSSGGLGYAVLTPDATGSVTGGPATPVGVASSDTVQRPVVVWLPSTQTLYAYYVTLSGDIPRIPSNNVISAQPSCTRQARRIARLQMA